MAGFVVEASPVRSNWLPWVRGPSTRFEEASKCRLPSMESDSCGRICTPRSCTLSSIGVGKHVSFTAL